MPGAPVLNSETWDTLRVRLDSLSSLAHEVRPFTARRTELECIRGQYKPTPHRVLIEIPHAAQELFCTHNLGLIEAAHPDIQLAFQAEGEASLGACVVAGAGYCGVSKVCEIGSEVQTQILRLTTPKLRNVWGPVRS